MLLFCPPVLTVGQLCSRDDLGNLLRFAGGYRKAGALYRVSLIEHLAEIEQAPSESVCVCTTEASLEADTYRLDLAIRTAVARGVKAVVFRGEHITVAPTARILAERGHLALLATPAKTDLGRLVIRLNNAIQQDAADVLAGAQTLLEALDKFKPDITSPDFEAWARLATDVLGRSIRCNDSYAPIQAVAHISEDSVAQFGADRSSP